MKHLLAATLVLAGAMSGCLEARKASPELQAAAANAKAADAALSGVDAQDNADALDVNADAFTDGDSDSAIAVEDGVDGADGSGGGGDGAIPFDATTAADAGDTGDTPIPVVDAGAGDGASQADGQVADEDTAPAPCAGKDCDDKIACTQDKCEATTGSCKHLADSDQCDDGNPCTTDTCDAKVGCLHKANSATCDDNNVCTGPDLCADGKCQGGAPTCGCTSNGGCAAVADACNDGVCTSGKCAKQAKTGACDDGDACTINDVCGLGKCGGTAATCEDGNPCTDDSCAAGACVHTAGSEGKDCGGGKSCKAGLCSLPKACTASAKQCEGTSLKTCKIDGSGWDTTACSDGDPCTDDACTTATCNFTPKNCNDMNPCTDDGCAGGACKSVAKACDDGEACTNDSCSATLGCLHAVQIGPCDDGSACTQGDTCQNGVCKAGTVGTVSTIAGSGGAGYLDGAGSSAQFNAPRDVAAMASGALLVADYSNHRIRKILPDGTVSTFAGSGKAGGLDGPSTSAQFSNPECALVAPDGGVYVSEASGNRIRRIAVDGTVSTLAGNGQAGFADGQGASARFSHPVIMTFDAAGNIVVPDCENGAIRRVTVAGYVTTLAGTGVKGYAEGQTYAAKFSCPTAVAYDPQGNLYVTDYGAHRIRRVGTDGVVTTVFGNGIAGFSEAAGAAGQVNMPFGISWHASGFFVVSDYGNGRVRLLWQDGTNTVAAGSGAAGYVDGVGLGAQFNGPLGSHVRNDGTVVLCDEWGHRIRKLILPQTVCDDGKPCTADACNPGTGICTFTPIAAGGGCEDGNKCTQNDTCNAQGACEGTPVNCDDGNSCTDDSCGAAGCVYVVGTPGKTCGDTKVCCGVACASTCPWPTWSPSATVPLDKEPAGSIKTNGNWGTQQSKSFKGKTCWWQGSDHSELYVPGAPLAGTSQAVEVDVWLPSGAKVAGLCLQTPVYQYLGPNMVAASTAQVDSSFPPKTLSFGTNPYANVATALQWDAWHTFRIEYSAELGLVKYFLDGAMFGQSAATPAVVGGGFVRLASLEPCCTVPADVCWSNLRMYQGK